MRGDRQHAEVPDRVAEGRDLLRDRVRRAPRDHRAGNVGPVGRLVAGVPVGVEQVKRPPVAEPRDGVGEPVRHRPVRIDEVVLRLRVARADDDAPPDPPDPGVGTAAGRLAPGRVLLPVLADVARLHEVRPRDGDPAPLAGEVGAARPRGHERDRDRRVRPLEGLRDGPHSELRPRTVLHPDVPVLSFVDVGRIVGPEGEDVVYRLAHHRAPIGVPAHVEELEVRGEAPGPDAHLEAPAREVVEHRGVARDHRRMLEGKAEDAGAELDAAGALDEGREEDERRGDGLGEGAQVLPDPALEEPEAIGEDDGLPILFQHLRVVAPDVVYRLHEHAELHGVATPLTFRDRDRRSLWHRAGVPR